MSLFYLYEIFNPIKEGWEKRDNGKSNVDFPFVVDEKHKILYCEMPKVGSTNWKRVMMKLTNPAYAEIDNVLGLKLY